MHVSVAHVNILTLAIWRRKLAYYAPARSYGNRNEAPCALKCPATRIEFLMFHTCVQLASQLRHLPTPSVSVCSAASVASPTLNTETEKAVPVSELNYDLYGSSLPNTIRFVQRYAPQLMDLVEYGKLIVYSPPATYDEQSQSDYQCAIPP